MLQAYKQLSIIQTGRDVQMVVVCYCSMKLGKDEVYFRSLDGTIEFRSGSFHLFNGTMSPGIVNLSKKVKKICGSGFSSIFTSESNLLMLCPTAYQHPEPVSTIPVSLFTIAKSSSTLPVLLFTMPMLPVTNGTVTGYNGNVTCYNSNATGYNGNATGYNSNVTGYNGYVTGYNGNVTGYNSNVTGNNGNVTGYNGNVTGYNGNVEL